MARGKDAEQKSPIASSVDRLVSRTPPRVPIQTAQKGPTRHAGSGLSIAPKDRGGAGLFLASAPQMPLRHPPRDTKNILGCQAQSEQGT